MQKLKRQHGSDLAIWMSAGDSQGAGSTLGLLQQALRAECGISGEEPLAAQRDKVEQRVALSVAKSEQARVTEFLGEIMQTPFSDEASPPLRAARQDADQMNEQIRRAFIDFIGAETAHRPLLFVLEDLHWGDWPTVRFLDSALRTHADKPWMVLALARPEVLERFPKLWAGRDLHQIHLKELSRKAAEQLIREMLGSAVPPSLVERLVTLADGQAFYLEELIRAAALGPTESLPDTVVAMVQARLTALSPEARRLLRVASVFGEVFWQSALEGIAGEATGDLLATLVGQEILVRRIDSRFAGEREYAFRHALLREGAYALLTDADLVLGHRLAAEWLELHDENNPRVLADHFERGERPLLAAGFYRQATAQAYYSGDLEATIQQGDRGLACGAVGIVREHLLGMLCDAHAQRWNIERAGQLAQELMLQAQPGGMAYVQAAKIRLVIALQNGKFNECVALVDAVLAGSPAKEALGALSQMIMTCVAVLTLIGQRERGEGYLQKLSVLCQDAGPESTVAQGWLHYARAMSWLGAHEDPWSALGEAEAARARFVDSGYYKGQGNAQITVGMSAWFLGLAERAERELLEPSASDLDLPATAAHRVAVLVDILLARGDIDAAHRLASETVARRQAQQNRAEEGHGRQALARVLLAQGALAAAEREAQRASELVLIPVYRQWSLSLLAAAQHAQGRHAEARGVAEQAVRTCTGLRNFSYRGAEVRLIYAHALASDGASETARQVLKDEVERLRATASRIPDLDVRQRYLHHMPANARLLQQANDWQVQ